MATVRVKGLNSSIVSYRIVSYSILMLIDDF